MTIIKVATTNPTKVEAIKNVFSFYFEDLEIIPCKVSSGVPEQPINNQVYEGALNRLNNLKTGDNYDYLVSCEGGLVQNFGHWFNQHIVMVEDSTGKLSVGLSSAFPIPEKYVNQIIATSLAEVLDNIFDGQGGIRKLTNGQVTRYDLIVEATRMALTGIVTKGW